MPPDIECVAVRAGRLFVLIALGLGFAPAAWSQQHFDLPSRPGVSQPIDLSEAAHPIASAILYPGGAGVISHVRNNFLIRVAGAFAAAGVTAAVADAPSDHAGGLSDEVRAGDAQAADATAIVAFLRSRATVPVWLIGTSRGSISAANAAVRLGPPSIAGVVLTSSVWAGGMSAVPVNRLHVPVLIVHNRANSCRLSPFAGAEQAYAAITTAPAKQLIAVAGGWLRGDPCDAYSPHGYREIEDQVVPPIVAWIRSH